MSEDRRTQPATPSERVPAWVKIFVPLHLLAITIWALPNPAADVLQGKRSSHGTEAILVWNNRHLKTFPPVFGYLFITGFWQYWDMFAPDPTNTDTWCDAIVKRRDGTESVFQYPRIALMPIDQKFLSERYRKFYERAGSDDQAYLWPVFAQRIAHLSDNPANPPVEVKLRRHWLRIQPPGKPQPTNYSDYVYFEYAVDLQQLERERTQL